MGAASSACAPGSSVLKMEPKSLLTWSQAATSVAFFFSSSSAITCTSLARSASTIRFLRISSWYLNGRQRFTLGECVFTKFASDCGLCIVSITYINPLQYLIILLYLSNNIKLKFNLIYQCSNIFSFSKGLL